MGRRGGFGSAAVAAGLLLAVACGKHEQPPATPTNQTASIRFTEVAREAGLHFQHSLLDGVLDNLPESMGSGVAWLDFDNDGDWDVYAVNGPDQPSALFRSDDGRYKNVAASAGVDRRAWGMGVTAADYDADGWTDLFVTNYDSPDALFRNNGDGTFDDVTASAGLAKDPSLWSTSAAWGDVDADGDLDLYVIRYVDFTDRDGARAAPTSDRGEPLTLIPDPYPAQPNVLYRNNGDRTFTDVTDAAGVADSLGEGLGGKGLGVVMGDVDDDGDLDIYVANDVTPNAMFRNDGSGVFEDVSFAWGVDDSRDGMGVDFGDVDDDADFDLICTNWQTQTNVLYSNNRVQLDGRRTSDGFDDVTYAMGLGHTSLGRTGWGAQLVDFNNDGLLDLYIANGYTSPAAANPRATVAQPDQVFRGDGVRFTPVEDALAVDEWGSGRGTATADYDDDGDVDILVSQNQGRLLLFRNETGNRRRWVKVTAPVGATLKAEVSGRARVRNVPAGSSYLSTSAPEVVFGLPEGAQSLARITMRLPDGTTDSATDVPSGSRVLFRKGRSPAVR